MSIKTFIKEETEGIKAYKKSEKKEHDNAHKTVYREILPDEKRHLKMLKEANKGRKKAIDKARK
jgi:rubrerythrin